MSGTKGSGYREYCDPINTGVCRLSTKAKGDPGVQMDDNDKINYFQKQIEVKESVFQKLTK